MIKVGIIGATGYAGSELVRGTDREVTLIKNMRPFIRTSSSW